MRRELIKRIKEYSEKEIEYLVGNRVIGQNRKLLKQIIILGKLLNYFCFIESSQHLKAARDYMVIDLRKLENQNDKIICP